MRQFAAQCATTMRYQLAEGPVWDGVTQRVVWVDIPAGDVHVGKLHGSTIAPVDVHHADTTVGAVAITVDRGLLVAGHDIVFHLDEAGTSTEAARLIPQGQAGRLNDGKCDPAGRFLIGTLPLGELMGESLYQIDPVRGVSVIDDDPQMSNGLAWSPDGHTLYSVDTTPGIAWKRPYHPATGRWEERRIAFRVPNGSPDGICADTNGNLWVTVWGPGEVRHFTAQGELLGVVAVDAPYTSCVTFVGPNLDRLLITTAIDDLSGEQLASHPQSGALFLADVGRAGTAHVDVAPLAAQQCSPAQEWVEPGKRDGSVLENKTVHVQELEIEVITLFNDTCKTVLTNLGARLLELHTPDKEGDFADIVLQRTTFEEMASDDNYMGSTAGRYANRIRGGKLVIDGQPVALSINEGNNHLHGGDRGFDRKLWSIEYGAGGDEVKFWLISPRGEEGYPGTLTTSVTYRLEHSALSIDIRATTDAPTVANIVHHSYFNLGGHESGTILDHLLEMRSSFYIPVDDELLPTGEVLRVEGTPFDFRAPTPIGKNIAEVSNSGAGRVTEDIVGYDHNWVLDGVGMRDVVLLTDTVSGRRLTMSTNQPGVQLYVGGYLGGVSGKVPVTAYPAFAGLTLETQTFPDAVNHAHFPQAELRPGETYLNSVRFELSTT